MRLAAVLVTVLFTVLFGPLSARAECQGADLMAALAKEDPEAHAAILARAGLVANGEGRLWRVRPPGGGSESHLFGTIHSTGAVRSGLPTTVVRALARARLLIVELSPEEEAALGRRLASDPGFAIDEDGPTLAQRFKGKDRRMAQRALGSVGTTIAELNRLEPWMLLSILAVPPCERAARAGGAPVLDRRLVELARDRGMPVEGLETYEEALGAFERMSEDEVTALLHDAIAGLGRIEDTHATMEALWAQGRIAAILAFNAWTAESVSGRRSADVAAEGLERALLADRNRAWLPAIRGAVRDGGAFVAVGALHLPGEAGLVALLRAEGFELSRVALP